MFDGNFRSRREVNLSSGSARRRQQNKRQNQTKEDILKNAEALRKQRQEQQRKEKAARLMQRITRGGLARLNVLRLFLGVSTPSAVSLCLALEPWKFPTFQTITPKTLLLQFSEKRKNRQPPENEEESLDNSMDISIHSITATSTKSSLWFSQKRLLHGTLQELQPKETSDLERQALYSLLETYWKHNKMDVPLFLDLTSCFQKWWKDSTVQHPITQSLFQWSMEAAALLQKHHPHSTALLASILLASSSNITNNILSEMVGQDGNSYRTWFLHLANVLQQGNSNDEGDLLTKATWSNLQGGKERRILSNILELSQDDPRPLVHLIHHVLSWPSQNQDLTLVASLMVGGDVSLDATATPSSTNSSSEWTEESDDEEDDNDGMEEEANDKRSDSSKKSKTSTRYSRRDLLTLVKLDKLYQDRIQQMKKDCTISPSTKELAHKIVHGPWLKWGLYMMDESPASATVFVQSLALLLQSTTSLRPQAKLGILSPLAFSKPFLEKIWKYCQESSRSSSELAVSVFCDLFGHYMVALSDVDFLRYHTHHDPPGGHGGTRKSSVMAQDIIVHLRSILYELYWTKPVLETEMEVHCGRGRLLLAATKVWNALYERWNRLVRQSFCDESTWWFPHLSSKEGDGAVIPAREQQARMHTDQDDEHEDSDDDSDSMDLDDGDQNMELSAADAETDALADSFRDPKMARVLTCIPQSIPFDRRVKLFHSLLKADKRKVLQAQASRRAMMAMRAQQEEDFWFDGNVRERVQIRRASLYKDSMQLLNELGPRLKHQIQVSFVNQHGTEEAGIDGGGVFKEFLDDLITDGFAVQTSGDSNVGAPPLFSVTPLETLAVNLDMAQDPNMQEHYQFLGRVLGKAVYESILVEPQFCLPFLNQLLAKTNSIEDLKNFDEEYYKNLSQLRHMNAEDIDSLGLTFELTISRGSSKDSNGSPRTVELIPGGHSVTVTKKNVFQYIHLVAHQLLNVQGAPQTRAFLRGFRDLIPASWVRLFSANELQKLISGDDSVRGIDVASLKQAMQYLGGYHITQPYIQSFWEILENDLTPEQQRKFLRFMTSCSRQPLLGFSSLEPAPSIQQIRLNDNEPSKNSKLPTSQTCMNLLKLPNYKDKNLLRDKLLAAIEAGAGFELT